MDEEKELHVSISEVYGKRVFDLIGQNGKKTLVENPRLSKPNLKRITDSRQIEQIINVTNRHRIQKSTDQNLTSSRSHALHIIHLKDEKRILFVDLAGFERSGGKATSLNETNDINTSLSALNRVLLNLSSGHKAIFRGNRLTEFLEPYLTKQQSKAVMFYHIRNDALHQGLHYIKDITVAMNQKSRSIGCKSHKRIR